ncbi:hypothetical protein PISMIDRAFT_685226 [Pisolithus microcarpus 441]|uniref:Uncharacterized protein n=1 Tax=Pisolithus microcarpus 441 TaxID=765257 RepID=A0A0C9YLF0_9AGAM|nr:hypothetical protein PISMIDRAFT_685226 [Pisolithus microcarpus 441]
MPVTVELHYEILRKEGVRDLPTLKLQVQRRRRLLATLVGAIHTLDRSQNDLYPCDNSG